MFENGRVQQSNYDTKQRKPKPDIEFMDFPPTGLW